MLTTSTETISSAKMLYGTRAIAQFLGLKHRAKARMLKENIIPHFRAGNMICASQSKLTQWLDEQHDRSIAA